MLLPITNISGKALHATVELRERLAATDLDEQKVLTCPELGNMRNLKVWAGADQTS